MDYPHREANVKGGILSALNLLHSLNRLMNGLAEFLDKPLIPRTIYFLHMSSIKVSLTTSLVE